MPKKGIQLRRDLTEREEEAYIAIKMLLSEESRPPSYDEIGAVIGSTRSSVQYLVNHLEQKGWIIRTPGTYRSIRLVKRKKAA